jgi:hypothetical protein
MTLRPIYDSKFYDKNCDLQLSLEISAHKALKIQCSIKKADDAWTVGASIFCIVSENQKNPAKTFTCQLPSLTLEPTEIKVIGAWLDVFLKENSWSLPPLICEDDSTQLDPLASLEEYANQNLLEITAYTNGVTVKSEYLQLQENAG